MSKPGKPIETIDVPLNQLIGTLNIRLMSLRPDYNALFGNWKFHLENPSVEIRTLSDYLIVSKKYPTQKEALENLKLLNNQCFNGKTIANLFVDENQFTIAMNAKELETAFDEIKKSLATSAKSTSALPIPLSNANVNGRYGLPRPSSSPVLTGSLDSYPAAFPVTAAINELKEIFGVNQLSNVQEQKIRTVLDKYTQLNPNKTPARP